jgi:hypothetical protein
VIGIPIPMEATGRVGAVLEGLPDSSGRDSGG